jgi:RNA polymerase sigma factor (sigma-70 family)
MDDVALASFVALVDVESPGLVAAARAVLGDWAVAEEVVQDVLARTYSRWSKVARLERPGAWVRRAVLNQAISVSRRRGSERRALDRLAARPAVISVDDQLHDDELWAQVAQLPADQCAAVVRRYVLDESIQDIASASGTTDAAVKSLLHRARTTLRAAHHSVQSLPSPQETSDV